MAELDGSAIVILLLVIVVSAFFGIVQLIGDEETKTRRPLSLEALANAAMLEGNHEWAVNIIRRSGYVHSSWAMQGSAFSAIAFANSKLRQAKIYDVSIKVNAVDRLEVIAFYESQGARRTGKYVGGFVIEKA